MAETSQQGRSGRLEQILHDLLRQSPELDAAAVVSFDGLPMASALPASMDEDRVAAMSAALLSLGERAAEGLGRGDLNQVYIEGEQGTVFLVSADDEAVLVAVASKSAKAGMVLYELRRSAAALASALAAEAHEAPAAADPIDVDAAALPAQPAPHVGLEPAYEPAYVAPTDAPAAPDASWTTYSSGSVTQAWT